MRIVVLVLFGVVLLGLLTSLGCAKRTPIALEPRLWAASLEKDPNVVWMVRGVEVLEPEHKGGGRQVIYGLFACYRKPVAQPGRPDCYLAMDHWNPHYLGWPGPALEFSRAGVRFKK